jgi:hypothetical protein
MSIIDTMGKLGMTITNLKETNVKQGSIKQMKRLWMVDAVTPAGKVKVEVGFFRATFFVGQDMKYINPVNRRGQWCLVDMTPNQLESFCGTAVIQTIAYRDGHEHELGMDRVKVGWNIVEFEGDAFNMLASLETEEYRHLDLCSYDPEKCFKSVRLYDSRTTGMKVMQDLIRHFWTVDVLAKPITKIELVDNKVRALYPAKRNYTVQQPWTEVRGEIEKRNAYRVAKAKAETVLPAAPEVAELKALEQARVADKVEEAVEKPIRRRAKSKA